MKKILCLIFVFITIISCKNESKHEKTPEIEENLEPVVQINDLIKDYNTWWSYHYYEISLASNFKALNENSEIITKGEFLKKLTSGNYIPIEMKTTIDKIYKLYKIPEEANNAISSTIKATSTGSYKFYKMEGEEFPKIDFVDLNGNNYKNENLKGKITVLKTWFISCKPCIEEMPELNNLVDKYQHNNQIQFLSLALDKEKPLQEFLKVKEFKYAVIPEQKDLIMNQLNLRAYPKHIIVDENGKIKKVLETAPELISYLENEKSISKKISGSNLPAPPPPPPGPIEKSKKNEA